MTIVHVVPGHEHHGVTQHALALLATPALSGQQIVRILEGACPVVGEAELALAEVGNAALLHLHLTDHLLAPSAPRCAELVVSLARQRPISLTLHDLPQPCDGHLRYERRRRAYALMAAHACGVVVASEHERGLLTRALDAEGLRAGGPIEVIPLPIEAAPGSEPTLPKPGATPGAAGHHTPRDLVVFGYLYPGKGHAAALDALQLGPGGQRADDEFADVGVLALGAPSPGHERLVQEYTDRARALGRRFTITGYLPDAEVLARLRAAAVPVAAADHVSASGSIGCWLAAGRRPLAPAGPYVDELDARCPGSVLRYGAGLRYATLAAAVRAALNDPCLTWLAPDARLGPSAQECGARLAELLGEWAAVPAVTVPEGSVVTVTVVVVHYDDQPGLDRVLGALERSEYPLAALRVVVADDGSPNPPEPGVRPYDVRLVRQEDRGFRAAAARNLGARSPTTARPSTHKPSTREASGDVIVFLDGDTVPEPGFVPGLARVTAARASAANGRALTVGRRRHADFSGLDTDGVLDLLTRLRDGGGDERVLPDAAWLEEGYSATCELRNADDRSYRFVISAVLAVTRELFEAVGGFDESFVGYGGEDWDLANRCYLAGAEFAYVPSAVAWHDGRDAGNRPTPAAAEQMPTGGAPDAVSAKTRETLRVAHVITEPGARDPGLLWEIPDIAVRVDDAGWAVEDTLLTCADLVRGSDARVWLRDGRAVTEGVWPPGDPRVQVGPVPDRVLARARFQVAVTEPVGLSISLTELCARGPADYSGLRVRRTRDLALDRSEIEATGSEDPCPVTLTTGDRHLEAEWGWRRKEHPR